MAKRYRIEFEECSSNAPESQGNEDKEIPPPNAPPSPQSLPPPPNPPSPSPPPTPTPLPSPQPEQIDSHLGTDDESSEEENYSDIDTSDGTKKY